MKEERIKGVGGGGGGAYEKKRKKIQRGVWTKEARKQAK